MCTTAERCSMCRCVSCWRPAEVDGLAFGLRRRPSVPLGTRSVMESLAAPSVEAMTPSTPLLPPNGGPSTPQPLPRATRGLPPPRSPWRRRSGCHPSRRPTPSTASPQLRHPRTRGREREKEGKGESEGEREGARERERGRSGREEKGEREREKQPAMPPRYRRC